MARVWLIWRRVVATALVLVLASLLTPTRQAIADPAPKLPGYSADQDPPPGKTPLTYTFPSANGLSALPAPSRAALIDINTRGKYKAGTEQHLYKSWLVYQNQRAPAVANPLSWADYRDAYVRAFNNRNTGTSFETALDQELKLTENGYIRNRKIKGTSINRRPDFHNDQEIVEIKTGAVDKAQLEDFLRIAQQTGRRVVYIFPDKPPPATLQAMLAAGQGLGASDRLFVRYYPTVGVPDPSGKAVLASGGQNPVNGGADQTTGASPDSPAQAIEQAFVSGQVNADMDIEQAAQDPESVPESVPVSAPAPAPGQQAPGSAPAPAPGQQAPAPAQQAPAPAPQAPGPAPQAPGSVPAPQAPRPVPAPQTPRQAAGPMPINPGAVVGPIVDAGVLAGVTAANTVAGIIGAATGGAATVLANVTGGLVSGIAGAVTGGIVGGVASGIGGGVASGLGAVTSGIGGVLGGVDFSTLQLRYISDTDLNGNGVQYSFAANTQTGAAPSFGGNANAYMASDSFFVWLALPTSAFTVNLNPNEPDRIIDAQFGRTDAGRILLEADYTMKQATAKLVDPATPDGRQFLDALKGSKCFSPQRKWIIPLPASVSTQGDSMYILDAPLDVKLEIEGMDLKPGIGCPAQDAGITRQNDDLYRTMILPKIVDEVNHAPEYADLRRVYASRIAAEWYRQRSATKATAYSKIVDSGNIDAWTSKEPFSPQELFDRYRKSFYEGDATYSWQTGDRTTWKLTIGGVDFTNIPMVNMTPKDFAKDHPNLPATASGSLFGPRLQSSPQQSSAQQVWLGGLTSARPMSQVWKGDPGVLIPMPKSVFGTSLSPLMYAAIALPLAAWIGVGGALWWRRRRPAGLPGRR
ncbi:hypothetical protein A5659_05170 [Mycobacterium sp. 1165196.3]|uniref:hypothetical protein n=1 Tax=unclassified Mycobacterium TaxID=2642494 RepID=UPI0007FBDF6A|nr:MULTISPECIES: hypothetical protein [unclassified Mycobacterium]OBK28823.1 hypothetical protein A5659_05170 [Mycobacterium sp. 1165196.3]OBK99593.1 hypothetical protein A5646_21425 [Mycobacterium sp. 1245499.0]